MLYKICFIQDTNSPEVVNKFNKIINWIVNINVIDINNELKYEYDYTTTNIHAIITTNDLLNTIQNILNNMFKENDDIIKINNYDFIVKTNKDELLSYSNYDNIILDEFYVIQYNKAKLYSCVPCLYCIGNCQDKLKSMCFSCFNIFLCFCHNNCIEQFKNNVIDDIDEYININKIVRTCNYNYNNRDAESDIDSHNEEIIQNCLGLATNSELNLVEINSDLDSDSDDLLDIDKLFEQYCTMSSIEYEKNKNAKV